MTEAKEEQQKPKKERQKEERSKGPTVEDLKKAIFIHNALIDQFPEVYIHLKTLWRKNGK